MASKGSGKGGKANKGAGKARKAPRSLPRVVAGPRSLAVPGRGPTGRGHGELDSRRSPEQLRRIDAIIDDFPLDEADPFHGELWASRQLGLPLADVGNAFLSQYGMALTLLERCRQRPDVQARTAALLLVTLMGPPWSDVTLDFVGNLDGVDGAPVWADSIGRYRALHAVVEGDVFGDTESIRVDFEHEPSGRRLAVRFVVDNNTAGRLKGLVVAADADDSDIPAGPGALIHADLAVEEALARLNRSLSVTPGPVVDDDDRALAIALIRPFVRHLLRSQGVDLDDPALSLPLVGDDEITAAVDAFLASDEGTRLAAAHPDADVARLSGILLRARGLNDGRPLRWSPIAAQQTLLGAAPTRFLLPPAQADALPDTVRAVVRHAAATTGMDDEALEQVLAAVDQVEADHRSLMADVDALPSTPILDELRRGGVDLLGGPSLQSGLATLLPGYAAAAAAADDDLDGAVSAAMAATPLLQRFRALVDHYDTPRRVGPKDRLPLQEAWNLAELLQTTDVLPADTKPSSAPIPRDLSLTWAWATEIELVHVHDGTLHTAHGLVFDRDAPVLWDNALRVIFPGGEPGVGIAPDSTDGTAGTAAGLAGLLRPLETGPVTFDDFVGVAVHAVEDGTAAWAEAAPKMPHTTEAAEVLRILALCGLAEQHDAVEDPAAQPPRARGLLVGGTVTLTELGRWYLASVDTADLALRRRDVVLAAIDAAQANQSGPQPPATDTGDTTGTTPSADDTAADDTAADDAGG